MDAQNAAMQYPYFWVEEVRYQARNFQDGAQRWAVWTLDISVKQAAQRDSVLEQEQAMRDTQQLCTDFLAFLQEETEQGNIEYDGDRVNLQPEEAEEQVGAWGWLLTVEIARLVNCYTTPARYRTIVLQPSQDAGPDLSLEINGHTNTRSWTTERTSAILNAFTAQINADTAPNGATALTDGVYLYLRSNAPNGLLSINTAAAANQHTWTQIKDYGI